MTMDNFENSLPPLIFPKNFSVNTSPAVTMAVDTSPAVTMAVDTSQAVTPNELDSEETVGLGLSAIGLFQDTL